MCKVICKEQPAGLQDSFRGKAPMMSKKIFHVQMINIHLLILKSGSFVQYDCVKPVATQRLPGCLRQKHGIASIKEMGAALGNAEEQWHKAIVLVVGQKRGDTILAAAPALKRAHRMKAEPIKTGKLLERRSAVLKCPEVACQGPHGWCCAINVQW